MRLKIENFGPIRRANLLIKPFTILVGPSSSGKSYLAYLIHALYITEPNWSMLHQYLTKYLEDKLSDVKELRGAIIQLLKTFFENFSQFFKENLKATLLQTFNINNLSELTHHESRETLIAISSDDEKNNITIKLSGNDLDISIHGEMLNIDGLVSLELSKLNDEVLMRIYLKDKLILDEKLPLDLHTLRQFIGSVIPIIILNLLNGYTPLLPIHIIPDTRIGLCKLHEVLSYIIFTSRELSITLPIANVDSKFVIEFEGMSEKSLSEKALELVKLFEKKFNIEFIINKSLPEKFIIKCQGKDIPLSRASLSLRELASIIYLLKYRLLDGSILIIEEPGMYLNANMQSLITRLLAGLVSREIVRNLIITTRSLDLLREVNNLIKINRLKGHAKLSREYYDWEGLDYSKVAIYLFRREGIVEEVKVGSEGITNEHLHFINEIIQQS